MQNYIEERSGNTPPINIVSGICYDFDNPNGPHPEEYTSSTTKRTVPQQPSTPNTRTNARTIHKNSQQIKPPAKRKTRSSFHINKLQNWLILPQMPLLMCRRAGCMCAHAHPPRPQPYNTSDSGI
ncbi:unnamed protein product [Rhizophagus irregularis]|nr:unnamed protein product [Rhizophagus irregularis]CAB5369786.1 unnamed protein product [Rhizophagus irregularis]